MAQVFGEELRIVIVEDDPEREKTLLRNLRKWNCRVTKFTQGQDALNFIHEEEEEFHMIIITSNMLDMDCFKFVEQVRPVKPLLPVTILMTKDGDFDVIDKTLKLRVCTYLNKPMVVRDLRSRMEDLFWQRNNIYIYLNNNNYNYEAPPAAAPVEGGHSSNSTAVGEEDAAAIPAAHKRKEKEVVDEPAVVVKKQRLSWSQELHHKFLEAVNQIGLENVSPKKICERMNVEGLSREQVSSHLQKYKNALNKKGNIIAAAAAADNGGSGTQVMTCPNSLALAPPQVINQNCNIAPAPAGPSLGREVSMQQMQMQMQMQLQDMSYNQQLMQLQQHDNSTIIPPRNNWNGGAAAAGTQEWYPLPPVSQYPTRDEANVSNHLYSHRNVDIPNSMLSTTGAQNLNNNNVNNNNLQRYLLTNMSYDDEILQQEVAATLAMHTLDSSEYLSAADQIFTDHDHVDNI